MSSAEASPQLLYVDADENCRKAVRGAFEPEWTVTAVESGGAATDTNTTDVDCFVVSPSLPETNWQSVYESLTASTDVPFILFATDPTAETVRQAFRLGVDDVIYTASDSGATTRPAPGVGSSTDPTGDTGTESGVQSLDAEAVTVQEPSANTSTAEPLDGVVGLRTRAESLVAAHRLDIRDTTLDVSRSLMSAADDEVDVKIEWALQSLATDLEAVGCSLYHYDEESGLLTEDFGWRDTETPDGPASELLADAEIPDSEFPGFEEQLSQFEAVCYDATTDDAVFDAEVGTLLAVPIVIDWQLAGALVVTMAAPRRWSASVRQQLTSVGEFIGYTERRRRRRAELERQNERLEQFTSVISHDLQNPLSVVTGYLELVSETGDVDRLDPAIEAAERMETMLNELLTLAREGRAVGDTEPVAVDTIVTNAWDGVDTPTATLETEGLEPMESVEADPTRLQEVFENLFRNAIDHVGEDVTVAVRATDGGVVVGDDGEGIPAAEQKEIFDHGYTGGGGTGLGLSIVETIVEGHGWEIGVGDSEAGGAAFRIDFDP
ncbi:ATP-binding response regulator [Halonotius roseus]|uniref:histidine kinase n=1 Tax=Halonotius roseus TaxID=2511997 RepID=A0A544QL90_9EURY|nr:ATP-binding protein [Halonotius roseus]TQQ79358.1 HAMP domain-containing histidine kinase [Halonotius roseus]